MIELKKFVYEIMFECGVVIFNVGMFYMLVLVVVFIFLVFVIIYLVKFNCFDDDDI